MNRNLVYPCQCLLTAILLLLCISPQLYAQQAPEGRKWVTENPKYVELNSAGIQFLLRDVKLGPNSVVTTIHLPVGKPWKVAFDMQMGSPLCGAMSIHLSQGKTDVAWLGADNYYKGLSAFIGNGDSNMAFSQTWDTNWHNFAYISDGKTLSLWHNGVICGEAISTATPDSLEIGCTQMEFRVRNVQVEKMPLPLESSLFFSEDFANPNFKDHWNVSSNGGSVLITDNGLKLEGNGKGFPVLTSRQNPFPQSGDWTASFGYHYTSIGTYGVSIFCASGNGDFIARVLQDSNGQLAQLNGKGLYSTSPNTNWHVASFVKSKGQLTAYLDGKKLGVELVTNPPVYLQIGGGLLPTPSTWSDLEVQFIKIEALQHIYDLTALRQPNPHLLTQPNPQIAQAPAITLPFTALPHQPTTVSVQENDNSLSCILGDTLHLTGITSGQGRLGRRRLEINDAPYFDRTANANENGYDFDWKPTTPGKYQVAVKFDLQKPYQILPVRNLLITVLPKAPLGLEQISKPVPASLPILIQVADDTVFRAKRVEVLLNGQSMGIANQPPFQVTLPISKQLPGAYTVSYQAFDAQGTRLNGETEIVTVPLRVQLPIASSLILANEKDTIPFAAKIVPDLNVRKVTYYVGDQPIGSSTTAPYDISADLSALKSGSYSVRADVLIDDGETFCNPPVTVTFTNKPDEKRLARLAKEEADKEASIQREEEEKQALIAKQTADAEAAKVSAELAAKRQEENYEADTASNTINAIKQNQILVTLDDNLVKIGDSYLFTLKVTNHSNKTVGPITPDMKFDDFSFTEPLAYDGNVPQPFDDNGFPAKYLADPYHDLVVPANATKSISYFVSNFLVSEKTRKPTKITFMGTLRGISIPLNP